MNGDEDDDFGGALVHLLAVHKREVAQLRGQVQQLQAALGKMQAEPKASVGGCSEALAVATRGSETSTAGALDLCAVKAGRQEVSWAALGGSGSAAAKAYASNSEKPPSPKARRTMRPQRSSSHGPSESSRRESSRFSGALAPADRFSGLSHLSTRSFKREAWRFPTEVASPLAGPTFYGSLSAWLQHVWSGFGRQTRRCSGGASATPGHVPFGRRKSRTAKGVVARLVLHPLFDTLCAFMILFNSILIGFTVQRLTTHSNESDFGFWASHFCSGFFLVELLMRVQAQGRDFCHVEHRGWNLFDVVLVLASIMDFVVTYIILSPERHEGETRPLSSALKLLKMLRIIRVFRVFRFFRELSLLALLIVDSMMSLIWAILLLIIIIYVFAIWFTLQATEHLKEFSGRADHPEIPEVYRQFGSLDRTVYSLVQSMLGGVSWGVVSDTLLSMDAISAALFFFYIAFSVLAVLNIITGVFVDNAFETARMQREFLVQKEMELREKYVISMRELFEQMDVDGNGTISLEEVEEYFKDPQVCSYFQALGLDSNDLERLFTLLDDDGSGELNLDEFLDGCLRLKGPARSIDVHSLITQIRKLETDCEMRFAQLERLMAGHHSDSGKQGGQHSNGQEALETMSF